MANIGLRPTALELIDKGEPRGMYGGPTTFEVSGECALLKNRFGDTLATANRTGATIEFERLEPPVVAYVNAFIAPFNERVERYWRTRKYRKVTLDPDKPVGSFDSTTEVVKTGPHKDALANVNLAEIDTAELFNTMAQLMSEFSRRLKEEQTDTRLLVVLPTASEPKTRSRQATSVGR